jgi:hypothetical protein
VSVLRRVALAVGLLAALPLASAGCEWNTGRPRRHGHREVPALHFDAGVVPPDGGFHPPGDPDPSIVTSAPVDMGGTQCPTLRLVRVDRRHVGAPVSAPSLRPRFYGLDEHGRYVPLADVLVCELRMMRWVLKPHSEGLALIMLWGPDIFEPDADCDWREPARTERVETGRLAYVHERCRRNMAGPARERNVTVELLNNYAGIMMR